MKMNREELIRINEIKSGWANYLQDPAVMEELDGIITRLESQANVTPPENLWFKAFSYFEPKETKVIFVGLDPVPGYVCFKGKTVKGATGLSFSLNVDDHDLDPANHRQKCQKGHSVHLIHKALKSAGLLTNGTNYNCSHDEWGRRGILLLNSALTHGIEAATPVSPSDINVGIWQKFMLLVFQQFVTDMIVERRGSWMKKIPVLLFGVDAQCFWDKLMSGAGNAKDIFQVKKFMHPCKRGVEDEDKISEMMPVFTEVDQLYSGIFRLNPSSSDDNIAPRRDDGKHVHHEAPTISSSLCGQPSPKLDKENADDEPTKKRQKKE